MHVLCMRVYIYILHSHIVTQEKERRNLGKGNESREGEGEKGRFLLSILRMSYLKEKQSQ